MLLIEFIKIIKKRTGCYNRNILLFRVAGDAQASLAAEVVQHNWSGILAHGMSKLFSSVKMKYFHHL
ncbi:hypothetical protein SPRA44_520015 [Serratia proteamaculans]|uniref:hypothetical protein n=1 Tax=Serratia proteamaculans TaxID=28151 RepID=UPI0009F7CB2F|nr:hypothetical protein [Serratia proteamaculans]SMB42545.1 hypothetical protein SPRA44_520015 [Serratia proteamaculans]